MTSIFYYKLHEIHLQQGTPTTLCCHSHASWFSMMFFSLQESPFSPYLTMVIRVKQFNSSFIRPEDTFPKSIIFVEKSCASAELQSGFLWQFWSRGFFIAEQPFRIYWYRTFTLCCCSGIFLHFLHQNIFISRRQIASPSWAVWWLCDPIMFIVAYYWLYRWMWGTFPCWTLLPWIKQYFLADICCFSQDAMSVNVSE